jgi:hypothetical protein
LKGIRDLQSKEFCPAVSKNNFASKNLIALLAAFFFALVFSAAPVCTAQDTQPTEYQIKAAFLFNFAKFVEWPAEAFATTNSPLVIGVLGQNVFGDNLERTISNKTINNRPLLCKEFRSVTEATNCQILFISASEAARFPKIVDALHGTSVLTVSESDQFIEAGGMINFVIEANKIRFQINAEAAKKSGLSISSKLLSLAVHPH